MPPVADVRFDAGPLGCEERALEAEARTDGVLAVEGSRSLPAENHHAVLERASLRDGELTLGLGLRTAPRFRRGECLRTRWTAGVDVAEPDAVPTTVAVEYLDADGDVAGTARVAVRRESA